MSTHITYITLRLLMLALLYLGGKKMSRTHSPKHYWKFAIIPILAFTLNEGLRFGRGVDYNSYYRGYHYVIDGDPLGEGFEPIFRLLIIIFGRWLGLDWQFFVMIMSFCLILSAIIFLYPYRRYAAYALPLFAIFAFQSENVMRWYFAFSFTLIGMAQYQNSKLTTKQKHVWLFLFFLIGFLIHYGFIIIELIYLVLLYRKRVLITPVTCLVVFGVLVIFSNTGILKYLDFAVFQLHFLSSRFDNYADNALMFLTGKGDDMFFGMSIYQYITGLYLIIFGNEATKKNPQLILPYNISLVGLFASPILLKLELGLRIVGVLSVFQCVVLGSCFKNFMANSLKNKTLILIKALTLLIILNYARMEIQSPMTKESYQLLYVWDANGRKYLDTSIYY